MRRRLGGELFNASQLRTLLSISTRLGKFWVCGSRQYIQSIMKYTLRGRPEAKLIETEVAIRYNNRNYFLIGGMSDLLNDYINTLGLVLMTVKYI